MTDNKARPSPADENESKAPPPAATKDETKENIFRNNKKEYEAEREIWLKGLQSQYAPPAQGLRLRRKQQEKALEHQIWVLAMSEAFASRSQRKLDRLSTMTKAEIIAEYFANDPSMERYVADHRAAGTCGEAVEEIETERLRRAAGAPSGPIQEGDQGMESPAPMRAAPASQSVIATFVSSYITGCAARGNPATQSGCEKAWGENGRGLAGRDALRSEFKKQAGGAAPLTRGRPKSALGNSRE